MGQPSLHTLFVTGEYPPMRGGVGAYTAELAKTIGRLGCDASVLTSVTAGLASTYAEAGDFNVVPAPSVYPEIVRWDWRIWPVIASKALEIGAEWIHVQFQTAAFAMHPAIHFAPWWWRRRGLRVAWTYHDLLVPYLFPKAGDPLRRWVTRWPARVCDLTVVTNEGDRLELAGKAKRLARIPIGSNIESRPISPAERSERRRLRGYSDAELVVGYFGFLNRSKGGLTLVQTLHKLVQMRQNAQLLMIGERVGASDPTNYAYLKEVEQSVAALGLEQRVQWTGHQTDEEVSQDLAACDVLLMPYEDGASLRRGTLMAGLAQGCAIVTTRPQAPLPELVDRRDLLYVEPANATQAADAVLELVARPDFAEEIRRNARQQSRLFTWEEIARKHEVLYRSNAAGTE